MSNTAQCADTRQHLRTADHQLLPVPHFRLNTNGRQACSVAGPCTICIALTGFPPGPDDK